MNVNIAMESIEVSKVHKILVKPFNVGKTRQDIISQLRIYKSKMNYDKLSKLELHLKNPQKLFELQIHELLSIFEPTWNVKNHSFDDSIIIEGISIIIKFTKMFMNLYLEDSNKIDAYNYIKQNFDDIMYTAKSYHLINLQQYALLLQVFIKILNDDFDEAINNYHSYLNLSNLITPNFANSFEKSLTILTPIFRNKNNKLPDKIITKIHRSIVELLEIDVLSHIDINENIIQMNRSLQVKYFSILVLRDDSIIFVKNKLSQIDSKQLYTLVDLVQKLSTEIQDQNNDQIINFNRGAMLLKVIDNMKYILIINKNTFECRLKLMKFILKTLDLVKSIPILSIPNLEDVKFINKLAKELFEM